MHPGLKGPLLFPHCYLTNLQPFPVLRLPEGQSRQTPCATALHLNKFEDSPSGQPCFSDRMGIFCFFPQLATLCVATLCGDLV